jgi:hypothetical protein
MRWLTLPVILLTGCVGKLEIVGQGDIISDDGRTCHTEDQDCSQVFTEGFQKTLTAVPREGNRFVGWEYCQMATGPVCTMDVTTEMVKEGFFKELPPVTARFAEVPPLQYEHIKVVVPQCELPCDTPWLQSFTIDADPPSGSLDLEFIEYDGHFSGREAKGIYYPTDDGWVFVGTKNDFARSDWNTTTLLRIEGDQAILHGIFSEGDGTLYSQGTYQGTIECRSNTPRACE